MSYDCLYSSYVFEFSNIFVGIFHTFNRSSSVIGTSKYCVRNLSNQIKGEKSLSFRTYCRILSVSSSIFVCKSCESLQYFAGNR